MIKIVKTLYQLDGASLYVPHNVASVKDWDKHLNSSQLFSFSFVGPPFFQISSPFFVLLCFKKAQNLSSVMQDQAFKSSLCINPSLCWTIRFPNLQLKRVMLQIPHKSMVIQFETLPKTKITTIGSITLLKLKHCEQPQIALR